MKQTLWGGVPALRAEHFADLSERVVLGERFQQERPSGAAKRSLALLTS
jgi:hypothetical protein